MRARIPNAEQVGVDLFALFILIQINNSSRGCHGILLCGFCCWATRAALERGDYFATGRAVRFLTGDWPQRRWLAAGAAVDYCLRAF